MLEIIGNNKHIDFLPECFDVVFVDRPSGKNKFLFVEEECHIDAIQLKRCLDEMTDEFAVILPCINFKGYRDSGHIDYIKSPGSKLLAYEDIGMKDAELQYSKYNVIYNPACNKGFAITREFHCDYVLMYGKEY